MQPAEITRFSPCRRHAGWLLAILLGGLAEAKPPQLPGPQVPDGLGVNIHFTEAKPGELQMIVDGGFRWVRMDFAWQRTERAQGEYDFSSYDRLMGELDKHRLRAMFILDYSNALYESDSSVRTAAGRQRFAQWAAAAVAHFRGRGIVWEIWNEPNGGFWKPKPDAADYAALAVTACQAIRAVAPAECIVAPATSGIDLAFLEECFRRGLLDQIDAVSVHPYRQTGPESAVGEYARLREMIHQHAPAGKHLAILSGEWGYSSVWAGYDDALQGALLPRQWLTNLAAGIPLSIWYDWRDDGTDPKEPEHHFGTVSPAYQAGAQPPFRPKPAYLAAQTLTRALAGTHFIRRLALGTRDDHVLLFGDGSRQVLACWTTASAGHSLRVPLAAAPVELRSHLGAILPVSGAGSVAIPMDQAPRYLSAAVADAGLAAVPAFPDLTWSTVRIPGQRLQVNLRQAGPGDFEGAVRVTVGGVARDTRIQLHGSNSTASAAVDLTEVDRQAVTATVQLIRHGQPLLNPETVTLHLAGDELLAGSLARADGDAKVHGTQVFTKALPPATLPGFDAPVWRLDYQFDAGWRFITVGPPGGQPLAGQPRAIGLWVHGDAGGAAIRMRVRDANGRTWQPAGPAIDWRGWRYVELALNDQCAHWGGKGAGSMCPPLVWDAVFLLDNISRKACSGSVLLAAPMLIE